MWRGIRGSGVGRAELTGAAALSNGPRGGVSNLPELIGGPARAAQSASCKQRFNTLQAPLETRRETRNPRTEHRPCGQRTAARRLRPGRAAARPHRRDALKETSMDLYLPDAFYALSESPNARREDVREDALWLGGEAYVAPLRGIA